MTAIQSAGLELLVSREEAGQAFGEALGLFVGRGRRYSVKQLANGSGVPDRLIESAMCDPDSTEYRALKPEHILSLSRFLGAPFAAEWMKRAGLGAFELPDDEAVPLAVLVADASDNTADLAAMAADDRLDGRDHAELTSAGHRDIARGVRLLAMAAGAGSRIRSRLHEIFAGHRWHLRRHEA